MIDKVHVSVVIPAYNQAHYLAEAVESVLAQTYQNFEIIVVDDGSTDDTAAVVKQFGPAVRYIYQENQGLAGARNTGIQAARGEYVGLLDSDDAWLPDYLEKMTALVKAQPAATIYYCGVQYMDKESRPLPQAVGGEVVPPDRMYHKMLRANFLVPSTILMERQPVVEAGLFDIAFRRLQDWELWVRLLRQGHKFAGLPDGLVRYRLHGSSLSTDPDGGKSAATAMAVKHFGADDDQWETWSAEKRRAYGGVYRYHALTASLLRQADWQACANYLHRAFQIEPALAQDLNLFYEIALGPQPLGQRGTAYKLNLKHNAAKLETLLETIFTKPINSNLASIQRPALGTAYHALGLVAYNRQAYGLSRKFLLKALRYQPTLNREPAFVKTLLKSFLGQTGLSWLRQLRQSPESV